MKNRVGGSVWVWAAIGLLIAGGRAWGGDNVTQEKPEQGAVAREAGGDAAPANDDSEA